LISLKSFRWSWGIVLLCVVLFQAAVPIIRDEAYFLAWGHVFSLGYYDHPPLPGWISVGLVWAGDLIGLEQDGVLHRGFVLALGGLCAVLVFGRLREITGEKNAAFLLLSLLLIPGTLILFDLFVNDTLIAATSLVFLLATHDAFRNQVFSWRPVLIAGLAFGALLLTKYSGALIYLGVAGALLTTVAGRRFLVTRFFLISLIAAVPFVWQLWWNYQNCGVNFAFNFSFRNEEPTGGALLALVGTLLLVTGSVSFQFLWAVGAQRRQLQPGFFTRVFLVTLALSLVIALWRGNFGGNWAAAYGFLSVLAFGEIASARSIRNAWRWSLGLTLGISLPVLAIALLTKYDFVSPDFLRSEQDAYLYRLHLDLDDGTLIAALRPYAATRVLAGTTYGITSAFTNAGIKGAVTLSKSVYGRNDDLFTDYRALDGADFAIVTRMPGQGAAIGAALFASYQVVQVAGARASYEVVLGDGFAFDAFRETWLMPFITTYYDTSPFPSGACYMDRYR